MRPPLLVLCACIVTTRAFAPPTRFHLTPKQQQKRVAPLALGGKDGEGLGDVLRKYGVVALVFHFSVWVTTLSASVAALNVYDTSTLLEALPADQVRALDYDMERVVLADPSPPPENFGIAVLAYAPSRAALDGLLACLEA